MDETGGKMNFQGSGVYVGCSGPDPGDGGHPGRDGVEEVLRVTVTWSDVPGEGPPPGRGCPVRGRTGRLGVRPRGGQESRTEKPRSTSGWMCP